MLGAIRVVMCVMVIANLGRVPLFSTGDRDAPLLLNDVCMTLIVGAGLIAGLAARSFRVDLLTLYAALFAFIGAFSAFLAIPRYGLTATELAIGLAYLVRWLTYFGFYMVIVNSVRKEDVGKLWQTLEASMIVFAGFGLIQSVFLPHFAQRLYPDSRVYVDFDEQGYRLVSTVLEPNIAGAMIMLVLLVQIAQLAGGVPITWWKPLLLLAAAIATLSRSTFLGMVVGIAIILSVRGISRRLARGMLALAVLLLIASPNLLRFAASYGKLKVDASAMTRVAGWIKAIRIFSDHPVLGIGFNTFAFVQERYGYLRLGNATYSVEGGLLFVAVMTGVVGLAVYLGMLALVVRRCRVVWRNTSAAPQSRAMATGIAAGTVGLCVHSFFVNSLLTSFVMEPLFVLWAIAFLLVRGLPQEAAPPSSGRMLLVPTVRSG